MNKRSSWPLLSLFAFAVILAAGCGGGSSKSQNTSITVAVSPTSATLNGGQTTQFVATVTGDSTNAGVTWSVNPIPGVNNAGTIDAAGNYTAPPAAANLAVIVTATSKADSTKSGTASVTVQVISVAIIPATEVVGASQLTQFMATVTGDTKTAGVTWAVNGTAGGNATVGTIDASGNYTAPATTTNVAGTITATSVTDTSKAASAAVTVVAPGIVAATANVQVASYTITPPVGANVHIEFGLDTTYGLPTWNQSAATSGGAVAILVAGMKLNSTYHMRAVLTLADGSTFDDVDHTFTTGTLPGSVLPALTVTTTPGATPQSGVELLDLLTTTTGAPLGAIVTDLSGNVLWQYNPTLPAGVILYPIKLLPNGHFLLNYSAQPDGVNSVIMEVDLAGTVVWQMNAADLNAALATATCAGCNITVVGTHHDFAVLPNGHLIILASETLPESGLTGEPSPTNVTGDVIIDLDQNHKPVWSWSTFDHLDLNRHLLGLPDWTHSNSVVYSPSDKALIVSMRHQSWVLKIDYNDGAGTGNILWKLGYQGDFSLVGGTSPQDWFSFQHDANVTSANSSGVFQMLMFDNGNQRVLDTSGTVCGTGVPCESRVPMLQLDETAKTATIEWVDMLSPAYSFFGGSARLLQNGNIEFDECGLSMTTPASNVFEVTKTTPPQIVWEMQLTNQYAYRALRIPSLYPGVQW
jgi:arylsulfate sulfotransferase